MKGSFDVSSFLAEKNLDIEAKTFKDIFPVASGPDSEETTSKFLYAIVEILLDFINQSNDRDGQVLDFHHPSQITKAMDFTLTEQGLDLEQLPLHCRARRLRGGPLLSSVALAPRVRATELLPHLFAQLG